MSNQCSSICLILHPWAKQLIKKFRMWESWKSIYKMIHNFGSTHHQKWFFKMATLTKPFFIQFSHSFIKFLGSFIIHRSIEKLWVKSKNCIGITFDPHDIYLPLFSIQCSPIFLKSPHDFITLSQKFTIFPLYWVCSLFLFNIISN